MESLSRKEEEEEERNFQKAKLNQQILRDAELKMDQPIDDSAVVDDIFGFLEDQKDREPAPAPTAFIDLPAPKTLDRNDVIMGVPVTPEDYEDLSEFKFPKFATTYFQVRSF
jgi:myosin-7